MRYFVGSKERKKERKMNINTRGKLELIIRRAFSHKYVIQKYYPYFFAVSYLELPMSLRLGRI